MNSVQLRFFSPDLAMANIPGLGVVHPCVHDVLLTAQRDPTLLEITSWEIDYKWIDFKDITRVPSDTLVDGAFRISYTGLKLTMAHFYSPPDSSGCYLTISFDAPEICAWLKAESNSWARLASSLASLFLSPNGFAWCDDELMLDHLNSHASFTSVNAMAWLNIYGKQLWAGLPPTFRESLLSKVKPFEIQTGCVVPCFERVESLYEDDFGTTEYALSHSLDGISIRGIKGPQRPRSVHSSDTPITSRAARAFAKYIAWLKFPTTRRQLRKRGLEHVIERTWPNWPRFPK